MTNKGESRLYSFIIWEKSRKKTDHILNDLKKKFVIRDIYEVRWSKENFVNNLHRFYGLPDVREKVKVGGTGPFLLILISDPHPRFEELIISNEKDIVNVNIYDSKMKYRKWIGGEFVIHSSISEKETNHNLTLLFGKNAQDLEKELPERWNGSIKKLESDLIGHNGWKDMRQLLYVLNGTMKYVVMRNFEDMPDQMYSELVKVLQDTLVRINKSLGYPPYNFILHTSPVQEPALPEYHWHFEIIPKLSKVAGFEWGSGFYINPTSPESAARYLSEVKL